MITVRINRKKWLRGEGFIVSRLLRLEDGKKCCIGFLATKLGATRKQIEEQSALTEVKNASCQKFLERENPNYELDNAYVTNDDEGLLENERESNLKDIGKEMGVNFVFYN